MPAHERFEYYKKRGKTMEVTTCDCCYVEGFRDAKLYRSRTKQFDFVGTRRPLNWTLITEAEARKRAPALFRNKDEEPDLYSSRR